MSSHSSGKARLTLNGKDMGEVEFDIKMPKPRSTICWLCGRRLYQWRVHVERVVDGHSRILHRACSEALKKNPDARDSEDRDE